MVVLSCRSVAVHSYRCGAMAKVGLNSERSKPSKMVSLVDVVEATREAPIAVGSSVYRRSFMYLSSIL